ncbi:hypothetical protein [Pseudodesulfovibrio alkaliphilus]|uniref:hypothetical protein n=1 Tax=Pseudodesulfovibrio alkaliphilus TaxID=2661613 RepID=UPI001E5E264C|nr:hypothetical protein [Pseudodesulfovibrio alkaliphilus]
MTARLRHMGRFIRAAPWPYMTGLASLLLACALAGLGLTHLAQTNPARAVVLGGWGAGWLVVGLFAMADGVSRYREYQRIKAMLLRFGYSERILEPLARSRCQRDAALLAAREAGHGDCARAYFTALGYRWYHILPDSVMRNPLAFLRPSFLRSSFLPGKKGGRREAADAKATTPAAAPELSVHTGHLRPDGVARHGKQTETQLSTPRSRCLPSVQMPSECAPGTEGSHA